LLFKKLHPRLEDVAHALDLGASGEELLKHHRRLQQARFEVMEILEESSSHTEDDALSSILDTLAANLTPLGENLQQSLILTQMCLEEAPKDLLPFVPEGRTVDSSWGSRMITFLSRLEDPGFQARKRWNTVDPEIGDEPEE